MPTRRTVLSCALFSLAACGATGGGLPSADAAAPQATLTAYRSEAEFVRAIERWRKSAQGQMRRRGEVLGNMAPAPTQPAAMAAAADSAAKSSFAAEAKADSITNVQTAGVDEGGIVKRAGDHLVILRRGRLFTVRIGGDTLELAGMVDAFAPGSNPQGAWYDELLISGSTVVVVGYSYERGGTEIGLFDLGRDGRLTYRATHHLRSFDYYSSRNYASRLIGNKLIFYTPSYLNAHAAQPWEQLPAVRRWRPHATPADFQRILPATRIYRTDDDFDPHEQLALHTITTCDLGSASFECESTAVLGPAGRVFYVSQSAVYVWTSSWRRPWMKPAFVPALTEEAASRSLSAVFRIPLDSSAPSAIKTAGVPIDQMSFLEDSSGHLNVLLRSAGNGEAMWGSESTRGAMGLLRVPLATFGDGRGSAQREHYRMLPAVNSHNVQNRFVGDWLLWGGIEGGGQGAPGRSRAGAWAVRYADMSSDAQILPAGHQVERIEAMGDDALLVGNVGSDLHFTSVRLSRRSADIAGSHVQPGASQGETRSHGFFFRSTGSSEGIVGLPVLEQGVRRHKGVHVDGQGSASVLYLRQRNLAFTSLGRLDSRGGSARDDACVASCVDWYGNARPIFIGERVFALLGYELVEGQVRGGRWKDERIDERRRVDFSARATVTLGRYSPFN